MTMMSVNKLWLLSLSLSMADLEKLGKVSKLEKT
jgi:hypothetical protein